MALLRLVNTRPLIWARLVANTEPAPRALVAPTNGVGMIQDDSGPSLDEIEGAAAALRGLVIETPVLEIPGERFAADLAGRRLVLKLELFQYTGSFKPRGALCVMQSLDRQSLGRGVTAVSAGNHAIAVAYAARLLGTTAKVVMMQSASPARIAKCRAWGAEIVL